ncbi:hypothetical protein ACB092_12G169200 [Castanea dentata]
MKRFTPHSAGTVYRILHFLRGFEVFVQTSTTVKRGTVTIGVNGEDLVSRKVTKEELKQGFQGGGYEKLATISLVMASVQSVANLTAVASSLATDGPEETLSCLIHMAKLQDPSIKLDKEAYDLLHGVSELKRDVILSSMYTHASEVLDSLMMDEEMKRSVVKASDGDTKKIGAGGGDENKEDGSGNGNGNGNGGRSSIIWGIWESVKGFF